MKVKAIIERGTDGSYDVNLEYSDKIDFGLFGQGATVEQAKEDFFNSYAEMKELYKSEGKDMPTLEFDFKFDVASFLEEFSKVLSLAGLERLTGVNQGQLSHYVTGRRKPSKRTTQKIEQKLHEFAKELQQVEFV